MNCPGCDCAQLTPSQAMTLGAVLAGLRSLEFFKERLCGSCRMRYVIDAIAASAMLEAAGRGDDAAPK